MCPILKIGHLKTWYLKDSLRHLLMWVCLGWPWLLVVNLSLCIVSGIFGEKYRKLHFGMHLMGIKLATSHIIMVHQTTNTTYYILHTTLLLLQLKNYVMLALVLLLSSSSDVLAIHLR